MKNIFMNKKPNRAAKLFSIMYISFFTSLFFPSIAFAYVDPGSGSVIVTTILGLIAAVGYTFRKYFYKIKRMITGKKTEDDQEENKE